MKKKICILLFLGLSICLTAGVSDAGTDDNPKQIEFVPPEYENGNAFLLRDLFRSDDEIKIDSSKVDEPCYKLRILLLITKEGNPKVLNINGKDRTEESSMNRLEWYVVRKLESKAMHKWQPAYIYGTPVDFTHLIPIIL